MAVRMLLLIVALTVDVVPHHFIDFEKSLQDPQVAVLANSLEQVDSIVFYVHFQ